MHIKKSKQSLLMIRPVHILILMLKIIMKILNLRLGTCISDLNGEEIVRTFYEKKLQRTNQTKFRIEKVIKRKGDKLYLKCKQNDNYFNSWIDKKDIA